MGFEPAPLTTATKPDGRNYYVLRMEKKLPNFVQTFCTSVAIILSEMVPNLAPVNWVTST